MLDYAHRDACRHQMLAAHLGETIEVCGTSCDFCAPPADRPEQIAQLAPELPDNPGQVIIECLASFPFRPGKPSLVKALTGSAASNVRSDRVRHFGALAAARPSAVERAINELVEGGYLEFYDTEEGWKLLNITERGRDGVPSDAVTLKVKKPKATKAERRERQDVARVKQTLAAKLEEREPTPEEADLFERLRAWRRVEANRLNMPPYIIFHDKTLWAIAMSHPTTPEELLAVKGVGKNQAEKYAADLFEILAQP